MDKQDNPLSTYHIQQRINAFYHGSLTQQRMLRRYQRSQVRSMAAAGNNKGFFLKRASDTQSTLSFTSKELRALNILKAYLKKRPYKRCENNIKPTTLTVEQLFTRLPLESLANTTLAELKSWAEL